MYKYSTTSVGAINKSVIVYSNAAEKPLPLQLKGSVIKK